ncbi:MAG: D-alanyl-D-alanine carboxypeptidase [Firmicutes bacterium]|nr:D-alanyl-D-alanine carboxypeptidase [Bacillota bacterium]
MDYLFRIASPVFSKNTRVEITSHLEDDQIKRLILALTATILLIASRPAVGAPLVTADSAVLIEASSGQVLYSKNAYQPRPPASTTKILTALIAIETSDPEEEVMIGKRPTKVSGSILGVRYQQVFAMEDLLKAALIISANDACLAIGEYIGGDEETFLRMMNLKAFTLGARSSVFKNTNGLTNPGHYSSAYDLAMMARYALNNPYFANIVRSPRESLRSGQPINNTNLLLQGFQGADGVKTGTTNAAGQCLVASATRDGRQLISVVLHSRQRFVDSARLLEYGFQNWSEEVNLPAGGVVAVLPVKNGNPRTVEVVLTERLGASILKNSGPAVCELLLPRNEIDPLPAGSQVGEAVLTCQGQELQRVSLVTRQGSVPTSRLRKILYWKDF